jgi:prephenate dehydratase
MAVFSDLMAMAKHSEILWPKEKTDLQVRTGKPKDRGDFFLRLNARNRPGALSKITGAFARQDINIRDVTQRTSESAANAATVPVVMICGPAKEKDIERAVHSIESGVLESESLMLPIQVAFSAMDRAV